MTREEAIKIFQRMKKIRSVPNSDAERTKEAIDMAIEALLTDIVRCKDCKWYDTTEEMTYGYCDAIKHSYYSKTWEINIRRTYTPDFFCADAEARNEEQEDE